VQFRLIKWVLFFLCGSAYSYFPNPVHDGAWKLKKRLLNLSPREIPAWARPTSSTTFELRNIYHQKQSWKAQINIEEVEKAVLYTNPIIFNEFHIATGFLFKHGVNLQLQSEPRKTARVRFLIFGTGPTFPMSLGALGGQQNISTTAETAEVFLDTHPESNKHLVPIDSARVSIKTLLLAHVEEATRFYFLQMIRMSYMDLRPDAPEGQDPFKFARYVIPHENCVSTAIRNLSLALYPQFRAELLSDPHVKKDISSFEGAPDARELAKRLRIYSSAAAELFPFVEELISSGPESNEFATPINLGEYPQSEKAVQLAREYSKGVGSRLNSMSLPGRARRFLEHVRVR
jgi:hypothetical protein